jgi:hypothetical protein
MPRRNSVGALTQQIRESFTELKTAADMLSQAASASQNTAADMAKASKENKASIDDLVNTLSAMAGMPGQYGPTIGGTRTPGYAFGRTPGVGGYQTPRPSSWPGGHYPGGASYGMGVQGGPGLPARRPQNLSEVRGWAAQAIHQRFGTGGLTYERTGGKTASGEDEYRVSGPGIREGGFTGSAEQVSQHAAGQRSGIGGAVTRGFASRMAGGMLGGEGALGGVLGASRAIPFVGEALMAAEAVYKGAQFIGNQRQANAAYQGIYDQSNMAGMGQRFLQEGYKLSQIFSGGLTGAQADQAFKAVSAMGYQGGARQQRLDFVQSNYKSMGMSVQDSMQLISIASQSLTTSLQGLHSELQGVSDIAKQTGQNAQVLRQSLTQNLALATNAGYGQAAGPLAEAMTASTTGLGRMYAGTSMGGMVNSLQQQTITAIYGGYAGAGQLALATQTNPLAPAMAAQARVNATLDSLLPSNVTQAVKQQIQAAGGPKAITSSSNGDVIARRIGLDTIAGSGVDAMSIYNTLQAQGITPPQDTGALYGYVVSLIAKQMSGGMTTDTAKRVAAGDVQTGGQAQKSISKANQTEPVVPKGQTGGQASNPNSIGAATTLTTLAAGTTTGGESTFDPVIQAAEKDIGRGGFVQVTTGTGQRVVTLSEAAKSYRDQLVSGTAIIVGAEKGKKTENAGKTFGEAYGTESLGSKMYGISTKSKTGPAGGALGSQGSAIMKLGLSDTDLTKVAQKYAQGGDKGLLKYAQGLQKDEAKQNATDKKTNAEIKLYMTPELSRWLGVDTTDNVTKVNSSANSGAPLDSTTNYGASTPLG